MVLVATPSLIKVAELKHLVDEPSGGRKTHTRRIPTIGGIIIFAATIFAYALWFPWDNPEYFGGIYEFSHSVKEFKFLIAASILIFFIGVKDDIIGVAPAKKLITHVIVGFILVLMADIRISGLHGVFGIQEIPYWSSVLLSIFTYIVVVNAFNLIDGSDGLAAGIGAIATCFFGGWFLATQQMDLALISFVLTGALGAFLLFNFSPARIFMGDSGALFIGAVIFALSVKCIETSAVRLEGLGAVKTISAPIFAMSVLAYPLIDTLRVFTLRILKGSSPFAADRNHIHHKLLDNGYSHTRTAIFLYLISLVIPFISFLFEGVNYSITFFAMLAISALVVHAPFFVVAVRKPSRLAHST